jgi:hypothetical protein
MSNSWPRRTPQDKRNWETEPHGEERTVWPVSSVGLRLKPDSHRERVIAPIPSRRSRRVRACYLCLFTESAAALDELALYIEDLPESERHLIELTERDSFDDSDRFVAGICATRDSRLSRAGAPTSSDRFAGTPR